MAKNSTLYDPGGKKVDALTVIAIREKLLDQRGLPSASQALTWLIEQDAKQKRKNGK